MVRLFLWALAGIGLGLIIHMSVILSLPGLAQMDSWTRVSALDTMETFTLLDDISAGGDNPFHLDPEVIYAVCQLQLSQGPGVVSGTLPDAFWSVSVFDRSGRAVYGTTNRAGIGRILQLGIFNSAQTQLLAEQQLDITEGLLIVESGSDDIFVVVRLAPPHIAVRARFKEAISNLECGHA